MFNKVRVKKTQLDYFRRKSIKAFPKEIQVYLVGKIKNINEIEVEEFIYPKQYHTQTNNEVCWYSEDYKTIKDKAELKGKKIVGDCHSHPNYFPIMSGQDYKSAILDGLAICGICSIYNKHTNVFFWTPTSALPCIIEYI
jgi:proteasome lid subunit RPN8/RPN11